ncbi:MAG: hypothetical protein WBH09_11660, partial [Rugosibacter sp.]
PGQATPGSRKPEKGLPMFCNGPLIITALQSLHASKGFYCMPLHHSQDLDTPFEKGGREDLSWPEYEIPLDECNGGIYAFS